MGNLETSLFGKNFQTKLFPEGKSIFKKRKDKRYLIDFNEVQVFTTNAQISHSDWLFGHGK